MINISLWWSRISTLTDRRCRVAALLVAVVAALYVAHMFKIASRSQTFAKAGDFSQSLTESQNGDIKSLNFEQKQRQSPLQVSDSSNKNAPDECCPNDAKNAVKTPKLLNLGWQGFNASCLDTVPSSDELRDSALQPGHVEITYETCCSFGNSDPPIACRKASKPMIIPRRNAETLQASGKNTANLSAINAERDFVFVTGASDNHYQESLVLVRIIQSRFPRRKIVYWDLGLTANQAAEVRNFCDVIYKQLDFSKYPVHVRKLFTYAFKPLCIMETLAEFVLIWWVDSSIRFTGDNLSHGLSMLGPRHGLVMFDDPGHSVWSTTYPQTFEYLATDVPGLQRTVTCTGASFIVANTPEIFSTFLYWLYVCALDERCIAPVDHPEYCNQQGPAVFAGCHRFDQSVMTIIAANFWGFGSDNYRFLHDYFHLERGPDGRDGVRRCPTT